MTKNEQIVEMAITIRTGLVHREGFLGISKVLYKNGYRKVERGEWKDKRCTKCGETMWYIARGNALATTFYQVKSKFCPECGADMRGEEE